MEKNVILQYRINHSVVCRWSVWYDLRKYFNLETARNDAKRLRKLYYPVIDFAVAARVGAKAILRDRIDVLRWIPNKFAEQTHDAVIKNMIVTTLKG